MTRLVALDLAPGVEFLESLARAFEAGYAVLPLDQRLSQPAKRRLVEHFGPTEIIGPGDSQTHSGLHAVRELMD
ncbi:MAG TPA: hypothetical protein VMU77_04345 [Acidimicrobiales bacterium]|nr:hypothetical protein [Acidimicrobiales bacterium]